MEYYKGEYNYRSAGTLVGIAVIMTFSAVLFGLAYRLFQADFAVDRTPRIVGGCIAMMATAMIAISIASAISFFNNRRLSIVISSAGISIGSNFAPWEQVSSLFGLKSLNGVFLGFTLKERYRSEQIICMTPLLTEAEFKRMMENLSAAVSSEHPNVSIELKLRQVGG